MGSLYDTDFALWSKEQARAIREAGTRSNEPIDWDNVAEEIESLGRSDRRAIGSHIATILEHLIKLQASPATEPRFGWEKSVRNGRREIRRLLKDSPSLRREIPDMILEELADAREEARLSFQAFGETPLCDLAALRYDEAQVLGDWFPERPGVNE